jgi:hypothetical protein
MFLPRGPRLVPTAWDFAEEIGAEKMHFYSSVDLTMALVLTRPTVGIRSTRCRDDNFNDTVTLVQPGSMHSRCPDPSSDP